MKIFFDTSISHRICEAITLLLGKELPSLPGLTIQHHNERFKPNADDYDWLNTLAREGSWIVLSADTRIASTELLTKVWRSTGLIIFVLEKGWRGSTLFDRAWRLVKVWPDLIEAAKKASPGSAHAISVNGKIKKIM